MSKRCLICRKPVEGEAPRSRRPVICPECKGKLKSQVKGDKKFVRPI